MKKTITLLVCLLLVNTLFSQLTTTDPALTLVAEQNALINQQNAGLNKANLLKNGKILKEAQDNLKVAKKQMKLLEDTKKSLSKVSNVLRDVNEISDIIDTQDKIITTIKRNIKNLRLKNVFSSSELMKVMNSFTNIIVSADKIMELTNKLLTNDLFKMKDGERLAFLQKTKTEMISLLTDIKIINRKFERISNNRLMRKFAKQQHKK